MSRVGERLPGFPVVLTVQRLVMEAAANRDYAPVHTDSRAAQASGARDMYANTTFVESLLEATIRSWAGPAARIRELGFAMHDFNCAGDKIAGGGVVTQVTAADDADEVELDVWIDGPHGRTVAGTAMVEFPRMEGSWRR